MAAWGQALLELAAEYSLLIIEDDPYGELFYESERAHLLAALDVALHGELRHVVYLSTFSKLLAPGLRVGWMVAPAGLARRLVEAKQGLDLQTSSLAQVVIYEACRDGLLDAHIPRLRQTYGARRDTMLRAPDADAAGDTLDNAQGRYVRLAHACAAARHGAPARPRAPTPGRMCAGRRLLRPWRRQPGPPAQLLAYASRTDQGRDSSPTVGNGHRRAYWWSRR